MALARLTVFALMLLGMAACGGPVELSCDEVATYQLAVEGTRVVAPSDLDNLEELREMPLPEASPQSPRPPGSPCIDMPPRVKIGD